MGVHALQFERLGRTERGDERTRQVLVHLVDHVGLRPGGGGGGGGGGGRGGGGGGGGGGGAAGRREGGKIRVLKKNAIKAGPGGGRRRAPGGRGG
ncbi:hypothetical protein, partial [Nocardia farcinica]|uniref:hypothetical protein n=1 Tax=Nocardia farcinica TaxID=37329 RepID=UPI003CC7D08F